MSNSKWQIPPAGGHMDRRSGVYMQNMTGKEVEERLKKNDLIIIPLGATEAHGPHACYGEDIFLVTRMAEQVALRTGCTVAQPLWYGSHPYHHIGMPGTVPVPEEYFTGMVKSIMAGFWNAGFRKQIIINGHGHEYVIPTAIHQFAKVFQVPGVFINFNWYHAVREHLLPKEMGGTGMYSTTFIHADEVETSWSLALFPEFIDMQDAVDTEPYGFLKGNHIDRAGNLLNRPIAWYAQVGCGPIEAYAYKPGVVGPASRASAEKAVDGVNALLDYLERLVNDVMETFPVGTLPPAEQVTMRDPATIAAVTKKPFDEGWRHLYTIAWPF